MKKIFKISNLLLLGLLFFAACKKQNQQERNINIDASIAAGALYELNLAEYTKISAQVKIVTQATQYDISSLSRNANGNYVYKFSLAVPTKVNGVATQKVIIKIKDPIDSQRNGGGCNEEETKLTINLTIQ
jgi:hypothetical protein